MAVTASVLGVYDGITDDTLKEGLEHSAGLLVDEVAKDLAVTLSAAKNSASFASSRLFVC